MLVNGVLRKSGEAGATQVRAETDVFSLWFERLKAEVKQLSRDLFCVKERPIYFAVEFSKGC